MKQIKHNFDYEINNTLNVCVVVGSQILGKSKVIASEIGNTCWFFTYMFLFLFQVASD